MLVPVLRPPVLHLQCEILSVANMLRQGRETVQEFHLLARLRGEYVDVTHLAPHTHLNKPARCNPLWSQLGQVLPHCYGKQPLHQVLGRGTDGSPCTRLQMSVPWF